jgi:hypothetical protein
MEYKIEKLDILMLIQALQHLKLIEAIQSPQQHLSNMIAGLHNSIAPEILISELRKIDYEHSIFIWTMDRYGSLYIAKVPQENLPELTHGILSYGEEIIGA